jgi:pimeloyl-ACP methyl ester carboxylesterase
VAVFERGPVSIYFEEHGTGFPLLVLAPGGMNSSVEFWERVPINPIELFGNELRVIAMDQRNAARSSGPLPVDDPWGAYADDQLGLMDHLGLDQFLAMGCCIGCSFILKLVERQPQRIVGGVLMQPVGIFERNRDQVVPRVYADWGRELAERREDVSEEDVERFGRRMWDQEFVLSVTREFLKTVETPLLVLPGNDVAHPTHIGLEVAKLLPRSEVLERWKTPDAVPQATERVREFLFRHAGAGVPG